VEALVITDGQLADCFAVVEARGFYVVSAHGNALDVVDGEAWYAEIHVTPGIAVGELLLKGHSADEGDRDFVVTIASPGFPDRSRYERELEIE
jgi:hypothetical protein